jgi:tRNA (guanine37-N1)-methyltransferase
VQNAWTSPFPPEAYLKPLSAKERRSKRATNDTSASGADPDTSQTDGRPRPQNQNQPVPNAPASLLLSGHDFRRIDHFVMNLPGAALEFLDAFRSAFAALRDLHGVEVPRVYAAMPMVHVHCFTRELEEENARNDILLVRFLI